jgi:dTMP kinase
MLKIEFEGTDGAGKTTSLKYFIEQARKRGLSVTETREVGNPSLPACAELREFILFKHKGLTGEAQELIFSAMRYENDKWLRGLVESPNPPDFVVSDRGWYSHLAYTDHNVTPEFTEALYRGVVGKETAAPDVVIYFAVDTETALKRRVKRGGEMDVIEMKGIEYQEKVRASFEKYMDADSDTNTQFYVIDANQSIEVVQQNLDLVLSIILQRRK